MNLTLNSKIESIAGVGPKMAAKLEKLGLSKVHDLLFNFPRKYLDYTEATPIAKIPETLRSASNDVFTINGSLLGIANRKTRRRGFTVTEAVVADDSGSIKVVWFNQPYLARMLSVGSRLILNGKVSHDSFSNAFVMESPVRANRPKIQPIYSETAGLSSFYIGKLLTKVKFLVSEIEEFLPIETLEQYDLTGIQEALRSIHEPGDSRELARARRRFAFEELFLISLKANLAKNELSKEKAPALKINFESIKNFLSKLPFTLTGDQKKAAWRVFQDLEQDQPMSRLLNGDVGSGKTIVAALAALAVSENGLKTLLMAPTEILANQHYDTFVRLFDSDSLGLWTSAKKIMSGNPEIIIGTQALIQKGVTFENIGLVITDEQHRFGVKQRQALLDLGKNGDLRPHFLSMTATPIPRTLHLALFGDLDISVIKEKPANRKEIKTKYVEPFNREKAYDFICKQIKGGRQVFVICPLIMEQESSSLEQELFEEERKSVLSEYEKLKKLFPDFKILMLHGKMKSKEKDEIMADFSAGQAQILVSTSVIEVGIDIPNATVMIIEDAERFGLAQIHQFRGRVGRSEHQSYCFLFSNSRSEKALARLRSLEEVSDGFQLAEIDLETRGPGAIFGTEQSGILDLKMATLSDKMLIEEASEAARTLAHSLNDYPLLRKKIETYITSRHLE